MSNKILWIVVIVIRHCYYHRHHLSFPSRSVLFISRDISARDEDFTGQLLTDKQFAAHCYILEKKLSASREADGKKCLLISFTHIIINIVILTTWEPQLFLQTFWNRGQDWSKQRTETGPPLQLCSEACTHRWEKRTPERTRKPTIRGSL